MHRFVLVCAAVLLCNFKSFSQFTFAADTDPDRFRVGLHAEGRREFYSKQFHLVSFDRFRTSYNTYNAGRLRSPMSEWIPQNGYAWGGGIHVASPRGAFYLNVMRSSMDMTASAMLTNGDSRELRMEMRPVDVTFDMLIGLGSRIHLGYSIGGHGQRMKLYSGYRYANGFLSYGTDQPLNGIFRPLMDLAIVMGGRMDIHLVHQLRITMRADYVGAFMGKQKGGENGGDYELLPFRDELYGQASSGGVHDDGDAHYYLPEDVRDANNLYVYNVGQGDNFAKMFRGWRYSLGLTLDLLTTYTGD